MKILQGVDIASLSIDDNDRQGSELADYDQATVEDDTCFRTSQGACSISADLGNIKTDIVSLSAYVLLKKIHTLSLNVAVLFF
jgi:hypothetical protein